MKESENIQEQELSEKLTAKEFLSRTFEDKNLKYELIEGKISKRDINDFESMKVLSRLYIDLLHHILQNECGEIFISRCDVVFSDEYIMRPDLVFIKKERTKIIKRDHIDGNPDIIMELFNFQMSEGIDSSIRKRIEIYTKFCVNEYWLINVEKKLLFRYLLNKQVNIENPALYKSNDKIYDVFPKNNIIIDLKGVFR